MNANDQNISRLNATNPANVLKFINLTTAPAAPEADGGSVSPLVAGDSVSGVSVSGDGGVASALTVSTPNVVHTLPGVPSWITTRLASVDLNSGARPGCSSTCTTPTRRASRALLQKFDAAADALGLDDELLDSLLADLG